MQELLVDGDEIDRDPRHARGTRVHHERARGHVVEDAVVRLEPESVGVAAQEIGEERAAMEAAVAAERGPGRYAQGDARRTRAKRRIA